MYKLLHKHNSADFSYETRKSDSINLLHKNNGANPYNVLLVSGMLTSLSVVITWIIEWIANGILLQN